MEGSLLMRTKTKNSFICYCQHLSESNGTGVLVYTSEQLDLIYLPRREEIWILPPPSKNWGRILFFLATTLCQSFFHVSDYHQQFSVWNYLGISENLYSRFVLDTYAFPRNPKRSYLARPSWPPIELLKVFHQVTCEKLPLTRLSLFNWWHLIV